MNVQNRLNNIRKLLKYKEESEITVNLVRSKNNPANIVSRGVYLSELSCLSFNGPDFLCLDNYLWPTVCFGKNSGSNTCLSSVDDLVLGSGAACLLHYPTEGEYACSKSRPSCLKCFSNVCLERSLSIGFVCSDSDCFKDSVHCSVCILSGRINYYVTQVVTR